MKPLLDIDTCRVPLKELPGFEDVDNYFVKSSLEAVTNVKLKRELELEKPSLVP